MVNAAERCPAPGCKICDWMMTREGYDVSTLEAREDAHSAYVEANVDPEDPAAVSAAYYCPIVEGA